MTRGAASFAIAAEPLTAEAVVRRIQAELGGDWPVTGSDGFRAGEPSTVVNGIATTAMATLDVLKEAVKAKANLIVTYEPTFYGRADGRAPAAPAGGRGQFGVSADDPVLKAKREFIEKNGIVLFRLRDHWQARKENDMVTGLADALGWSNRRGVYHASRFEIVTRKKGFSFSAGSIWKSWLVFLGS